jgi:hypothetical protein
VEIDARKARGNLERGGGRDISGFRGVQVRGRRMGGGGEVCSTHSEGRERDKEGRQRSGTFFRFFPPGPRAPFFLSHPSHTTMASDIVSPAEPEAGMNQGREERN